MFNFKENSVLIVVDYQNDFIDGKLPVPEAKLIKNKIVKYIELANLLSIPVIPTKDYHPVDHCSFKEYGGRFPPHCIRGTMGAMIERDVDNVLCDIKGFPESPIFKGTHYDVEEYSGFAPKDKDGESILLNRLLDLDILNVYICGLATDYCVKETAFDANEFDVFVLTDAIKGMEQETTERALIDMINAEVQFVKW